MHNEHDTAKQLRDFITNLLLDGHTGTNVLCSLAAVMSEFACIGGVKKETAVKIATTALDFCYADEAEKSRMERESGVGGSLN